MFDVVGECRFPMVTFEMLVLRHNMNVATTTSNSGKWFVPYPCISIIHIDHHGTTPAVRRPLQLTRWKKPSLHSFNFRVSWSSWIMPQIATREVQKIWNKRRAVSRNPHVKGCRPFFRVRALLNDGNVWQLANKRCHLPTTLWRKKNRKTGRMWGQQWFEELLAMSKPFLSVTMIDPHQNARTISHQCEHLIRIPLVWSCKCWAQHIPNSAGKTPVA